MCASFFSTAPFLFVWGLVSARILSYQRFFPFPPASKVQLFCMLVLKLRSGTVWKSRGSPFCFCFFPHFSCTIGTDLWVPEICDFFFLSWFHASFFGQLLIFFFFHILNIDFVNLPFSVVVCRSRRTIPSLSMCLCMRIQATNDKKKVWKNVLLVLIKRDICFNFRPSSKHGVPPCKLFASTTAMPPQYLLMKAMPFGGNTQGNTADFLFSLFSLTFIVLPIWLWVFSLFWINDLW